VGLGWEIKLGFGGRSGDVRRGEKAWMVKGKRRGRTRTRTRRRIVGVEL